MTLNYPLVNHDKGTYMYTYKANVIKVVDGDTVDLDIDLGFGIVFKKQRELHPLDFILRLSKCQKSNQRIKIQHFSTEFFKMRSKYKKLWTFLF